MSHLLEIAGKKIKIAGKLLSTPTAVTLWTPSDIVAQTYQWDASNSASISDTGGLVDELGELLGSSENLVQTGTARMTTGARTLNSLNVLDGDGGDYMECLSFPMFSSGDKATFTVAGMDVISATTDSVHSMNSASNDYQFEANNNIQFNGELNVTGVGADKVLTGGPFSGPSIYEDVFDFSGSGLFNAYVDGAKRTTDTTYTNKLDTPTDIRIFSNRAGSNYPDGLFAEKVITEDVTTTTRQLIEGYLAHKWGISGNLPVSHPYKNSPPTV